MPYITTKVTTPLPQKKIDALTEAYGKLIEIFPGKTERWLMLDFTGDTYIVFGGPTETCSMVEIELFGKASAESYDKMTDAVCAMIEVECAIPADRVYVKYAEVAHWGWNHANF